jgi:hypothetical protein
MTRIPFREIIPMGRIFPLFSPCMTRYRTTFTVAARMGISQRERSILDRGSVRFQFRHLLSSGWCDQFSILIHERNQSIHIIGKPRWKSDARIKLSGKLFFSPFMITVLHDELRCSIPGDLFLFSFLECTSLRNP